MADIEAQEIVSPRARSRTATPTASPLDRPAAQVARRGRARKTIRIQLTLDSEVVTNLDLDSKTSRIRKTPSQRANEILTAHYRDQKASLTRRVAGFLDLSALNDLATERTQNASKTSDAA
jgi:hypothetical protein